MFVDFNILNQLGSPSINSNTFANRPAAGQIGRLFVSTDTFEIYRDTGTTWDLIGGPGSSTITGTGTATQVAYFTGAQTIASSANLFWDNTAGSLGINTSTPGAELDVHGTGTLAQFNTTSATGNVYVAFQRTGTGIWRIGDTYNGGNNFFELHNTILTIDALEFEATTNKSTFLAQQTYASGLATGNQFTYNLTVPNGVNITSPNAVHAVNSYFNLSLGGNTTVPAGTRQGLEGNSRISFTGAGTLTMTQAATVRAFSALSSVYSFNGSAIGTITHLAGLRICFPDNIGSAINITNNYGLLLNDQTAGTGTVTYTNRWGIYQEGASDLNYFNGNLLVKTTTNAGFAADINGTARVQGVITGSVSGGTLTLGAASANVQAIGVTGFFTSGGAIYTLNLNQRGYDARVNVQDQGAFWASGISNAQVVSNTNAFFRGSGAINYSNAAVGSNFNGVLFDPSVTAQVNTVIYAFRSTLASATDRWNLYMEGTALNYLAGNLLLNTTTNAGYRLDVNGTQRVQFGSTERGAVFTHSNGNSAEIVIGNGSAASTGAVEIFRNNAFAISFRSTGAFLGTAYNRLGYNGALTFTGGFGGATLGNSITLASNTIDAGQFTATSGTQNTVRIGIASAEIWQPSSGNATYNLLSILPRINTSGTYSGIVRGLFIDPTLTSTTGTTYRAIEVSAGDVILGSTSGSTSVGATTTINASAILQVTSTTQGFLPPRMTTAQKNAIAAPAAGLTIYDTTLNKLCVFTGVNWETVTSV